MNNEVLELTMDELSSAAGGGKNYGGFNLPLFGKVHFGQDDNGDNYISLQGDNGAGNKIIRNV